MHPLGRPEVGKVQGGVDADCADDGGAHLPHAFDQQLRPDQDPAPPLELLPDAELGRLGGRGLGIQPHDRGRAEEFPRRLLHSLSPDPVRA